MEGFQSEAFPLITGGTWTAGADFPVTLQNLPDLLGNAIAHVISFDITLNLTPTYTTAPTNVGHNFAVRQVQLFDGERDWIQQCGFNALRAFERGENRKLLLPDAILGNGSTNPRYIRRRLSFGPPGMKWEDGLMPCSQLNQGGLITLSAGALTDISADCTASTGTYDITANLVGLQELRIPPWYQRIMLPLTNGTPVSQKALYALIMMINSTSYDAFAAGDLGNISLDGVEGGVLLKPTKAQQLTLTAQADAGNGNFDVPTGDPANATYDVNARQLNLTTPTAFAAQALDLQLAQWLAKDARITKLPANIPSALTVTISGSNSGTQCLFGRYLPYTATMAAETANRCFRKLTNRSWGSVGLRLGSKKMTYGGNRQDYLPKRVQQQAPGVRKAA